jgi:thymidylate synthase (FAD)
MKAEYIAHMGSDITVVNSARVSFDKESQAYIVPERDGTERTVLFDADARLIHYLARHNHWTPFSHCQITLRETVPIFVARQRFKHMVGFTYNEVSRRYVDTEPRFYEPVAWRKRAQDKKQGSLDEHVNLIDFDCRLTRPEYLTELALETYNELLRLGVAPEQARMVLPQSMYTSYYVTGSLAAFARAYNLRSAPDAQLEIRELAGQWDDIIEPLYPTSWKALTR